MLRSVMCTAGPERALADAQLALELEPAWSMWRDQALSLAGEAELLLGHIDAADRHFAEASELATSSGNSDGQVLCDSERAIIAMDRGNWAEADALLASALRTVDEQHLEDYATAVLALANGVHARIACSWNLDAGADAVIGAELYGTDAGAAMHNENGSFFDFSADLLRGRDRERLASPPDDWGGRAAAEWVRKLASGERFAGSTDGLLETAQVLDRLYGRTEA
jgi:hypothetical protein